MRKKLALALTGVATLFALTACGGGTATTPSAEATLDPANPTIVKVGSSPIPHAQILQYIDENLAKDAGIDLEITEIDDYQTPNIALADKTLDANYFQTEAYLADQVKSKGYKFEHGAGIHVEPLTVFSKKFKDIAEVTEGSTVLLNNDPVNQLRGLRVLETAGVLTGLEDTDSALTLEGDEAKNPKKLTFKEVNSEQVPKFYAEDPTIGLSIINGNYIAQAKLNLDEVVAQESAIDNPNANFLTWREGEKTAAIAKLEELLHSAEVGDYIKKTWTDGSVIPAF
ncbi:MULTISPECIES: MetQ/NlpA family ABC transporter substrate-binding protein [Paeniglutamicibacter]|uniref:D-methionine transport system substrate-binding protein n=1 Tax=Paeniglutamicibacter sulfureus TaxID=43666 RepID=A0ABU2BQV3_9MICC|nr:MULTISPECIES: MetQ/NlpA family ABC transporter substrate-binding protein [Paeniglutamicibacter]MCV9995699.1 MetQ/NlpA family ABC transporter substrate-binding protein [Paeniglutamicibacter sp. ZC-3]MDR7360133.1 D-methionine transport system substrate-binding protein [Paeniglutamicibacter sulfureus]